MYMLKQIYASLEISEREVRILVGEYFNTRFNILKLAKVPCEGVTNSRIIDKEKVKEAIKNCLKEAEDRLNTKLESIILLIPAVNYKRIPLKVNVVPSSGGLKKEDIVRALSKTLDVHIDTDLIVVNRLPVKYTVNGISSRRMPENELCDEVMVDIDLLCADKLITYDYVGVVEECGIQVLDICLDTYAICKEAVLIEQSLNKNIILLDINNYHSSLSLISRGKLLSTENIQEGIGNFVSTVYTEYQLPYNTLLKLVKFNSSNTKNGDDTIFAYANGDKSISISQKQLNNLIKIPLNKIVDDIVTMSSPIVESGETQFVVVGEGADMVVFCDELEKKSGCEVKVYHPDTLGVRESDLIALFGSFFVLKETANLRDMKVACVDLVTFDRAISNTKIDLEGETITTKIKSLFKNIVKENGDE